MKISLADLKSKATSSELTLILAVESALRGEVVQDVKLMMSRAGEEFVKRNAPTSYTYLKDWAVELMSTMVKAAETPNQTTP